MFERYTEKARRVIFFARYEASQFGSPYIETEHLLLGLLREDKELSKLVLRRGTTEESIRQRIAKERPPLHKIPTNVDMPISELAKRTLSYAAEEAGRLSHRHIGTEHLLLGLAREEEGLAANILHDSGLELISLRRQIGRRPDEDSVSIRAGLPPLLQELSRDFSEAAERGELDPLVGRSAEFEQMMQILCRSEVNNVALLGEPGVGKQAAVEGLAYCIAKGTVPAQLEDFRIVQIVLSPIVALLRESARVQDRLKDVVNGLASPARTIFYVEGLFDEGVTGAIGTAHLLRPLLSMGEIQCIAVATRREYEKAIKKEPWLEECFRIVELKPPGEAVAIQILSAVKPRYERFHNVKYSDDALKQAVVLSRRFLPHSLLPDIAIDLMDDAGAACALRRSALPDDVREVQHRINIAKKKEENALSNHEFIKARTYSDDEAKQRAELQRLFEKYKIDLERASIVGVAEIEQAVARRAGIPVEKIRGQAEPGAKRSGEAG